MKIGPFGSGSAGVSGRSGEVKAWVSRAFGLNERESVTVMELRCNEPGCPPVETAVAILGDGESRQYKVHKPLAEVTFEDVERLAALARGAKVVDTREKEV